MIRYCQFRHDVLYCYIFHWEYLQTAKLCFDTQTLQLKAIQVFRFLFPCDTTMRWRLPTETSDWTAARTMKKYENTSLAPQSQAYQLNVVSGITTASTTISTRKQPSAWPHRPCNQIQGSAIWFQASTRPLPFVSIITTPPHPSLTPGVRTCTTEHKLIPLAC